MLLSAGVGASPKNISFSFEIERGVCAWGYRKLTKGGDYAQSHSKYIIWDCVPPTELEKCKDASGNNTEGGTFFVPRISELQAKPHSADTCRIG